MEELEQPKQDNIGSSENLGKFRDVDSLLKAYNSLESEFTRKSQRLAELESERVSSEKENARLADIDRRVDEFVTKFDFAIPFSSALKESLAEDENLNLESKAMELIANNYKSAKDYACDSEFLNNYIYSNQDIKDRIIKDYLSNVTQSSPIKVDNSGSILLTAPKIPTTIKEAGDLAKSIIKQK